jgi:hypothetical protein
MAIEGPLRELGIHDVFQLLDLSKKTGVLKITSDLRQNAGTIYFEGGAVMHAEIRSNPHPLGRVLVRAGKITEADLERARSTQERQSGQRLGEILVGIRALSPRELERQAKRQVEEVVFEIMGWEEGYFSFVEEALRDVEAEAAIRVPIGALLMEGARRIDEWSRIQRRIPNVHMIPVFQPAPAGDDGLIDLLPPEWETLAAIDGDQDIRSLAATLGRSEFEVAKTLFGLASTGIITFLEAPSTERAGASGDEEVDSLLVTAQLRIEAGALEEALVAAQFAARLEPHDPLVRATLARVHLAAGRPGAADAELRRALRLDPECGMAYRLIGYASCALGRFDEAAEAWERWAVVASDDPDEERRAGLVRRAREAALLLARAIRGTDDD